MPEFDEAMVQELAWALFALECAGGPAEEDDNSRLRRHAEKILAELSKEYTIVPKAKYRGLCDVAEMARIISANSATCPARGGYADIDRNYLDTLWNQLNALNALKEVHPRG